MQVVTHSSEIKGHPPVMAGATGILVFEKRRKYKYHRRRKARIINDDSKSYKYEGGVERRQARST